MDNHKERITLSDSPMDIIMKLSDGNPGAVSVLMQLYQEGSTIDPQMVLGGIGYMMLLDTWGVYGPDIWVLYKDICGQNIKVMMVLMRAAQLGIVTVPARQRLQHFKLADMSNMPSIVAALHQRLPDFDISGLAP